MRGSRPARRSERGSRVEFGLQKHFGYQWAIAGFEIFTILALILILALGKERKGRSFHRAASELVAP